MRPIGYYVHHHGDGHRQRALALAAGRPERFTLLGTGLRGRTGDVRAIDLPDDRMSGTPAFDGIDGTAERPHALHYAPLDHDGVRARMALMAQWMADERPALLVVDVSVEIAMLARLCATPVAFMRLSGRRDDAAHCEAYRASSLLLAPFAAPLDDPGMPDWVRERTVYCPGLVAAAPPAGASSRRVLVIAGRGGTPLDGTRVAAAASATPDRDWRVIGPAQPAVDCPANLVFAGWVDDAAAEIAEAGIVVGAAGDGVVNGAIAAGKPFICCPEPRPFDEQIAKARQLQALSAAVVIPQWPAADDWPALLAAAECLDRDRLRALGDPHGAAHALAVLERFADAQK